MEDIIIFDTTEAYKHLFLEAYKDACHDTVQWESPPGSEGVVGEIYQCVRSDAQKRLAIQFLKDSVCITFSTLTTKLNG